MVGRPAARRESFLTTLRASGGALVQAGRIGELGKGERVYAVRFVGDTGYVVTFRQIDPLYTIDSPTPERPRVLGELKIPGYSAYLHPIGEDLLLGIGQDASEEGRPTGTQLSLFDVSDLRKPTRLHTEHARPGLVGGGVRPPRVPLLAAHRARRDPVRAASRRLSSQPRARDRPRSGASTHEAGKLSYTPGVRRSLVVRDAVLTVSDAGVKSSSLATLAERGWAAFPPPAQPEPRPRPVASVWRPRCNRFP